MYTYTVQLNFGRDRNAGAPYYAVRARCPKKLSQRGHT